MNRGLYVAFEGIDGSGKTLQAEKLFGVLRDEGVPVFQFREPGGTKSAEAIRSLVLHSGEQFTPLTEALLMNGVRAATIPEVESRIVRGETGIADRCWLATLAYQGYGSKMPPDEIEWLRQLCAHVVGKTTPDIIIVIDVPVPVAFARIKDKKPDYFERRPPEFFERVRRGFLEEARRNSGVIRVINGEQAPEIVADHVLVIVETLLHERGLLNSGR